MNWDQIESKWADMARRVAGELPTNRTGSATPMQRDKTQVIEVSDAIADLQVNEAVDLQNLMSTQ